MHRGALVNRWGADKIVVFLFYFFLKQGPRCELLLRPGCVPGLVLVGWSDILGFHLRDDTHGNPVNRILSIETISVKCEWLTEKI